MASVNLTVSYKVYGPSMAIGVCRILSRVGVDEERCAKIAKSLIFIKMKAGKKTSWMRASTLGE